MQIERIQIHKYNIKTFYCPYNERNNDFNRLFLKPEKYIFEIFISDSVKLTKLNISQTEF